MPASPGRLSGERPPGRGSPWGSPIRSRSPGSCREAHDEVHPGCAPRRSAGLAGRPAPARRRDEQTYSPGSFNWAFLHRYPQAARLFNAFDYGHAVLYEELYLEPGAPVDRLERREVEVITADLLPRPPRFAIAEEAVAPAYTRLAWRAKQMFDWAHLLHPQIYDRSEEQRI